MTPRNRSGDTNQMARKQTMQKIISVCTIDGILTSAALIRYLSNKKLNSDVVFTKDFPCHQCLESLQKNDSVWLVGLPANREYTRTFIFSIFSIGAFLEGVIDEHNADDWREVLPEMYLTVYPKTRSNKFPSSSAVLREALSEDPGWDNWCDTLTMQADNQGFFVRVANIVFYLAPNLLSLSITILLTNGLSRQNLWHT